MGVYIKGMEMPKSCSVCREIYYVPDSVKGTSVRCGIDNKLIHQYSKTVYDIESGFPYKTNRPGWCPLGDVPAPHGRLIDADLLGKILKRRAEDELNKNTAPFSWSYAYECLIDTLDTMPTVIEAEEGD